MKLTEFLFLFLFFHFDSFTYLMVFSLSLLDHWLNSFDANKWQNSQSKIIGNSFSPVSTLSNFWTFFSYFLYFFFFEHQLCENVRKCEFFSSFLSFILPFQTKSFRFRWQIIIINEKFTELNIFDYIFFSVGTSAQFTITFFTSEWLRSTNNERTEYPARISEIMIKFQIPVVFFSRRVLSL